MYTILLSYAQCTMHNVPETGDAGIVFNPLATPQLLQLHFETFPRTRHIDGQQKFIDLVLLDKFYVLK